MSSLKQLRIAFLALTFLPLIGEGKALPSDVQDIIKRKAGCGHWSGEDGYDEERKKEIESALKELKCAEFEKDLKKIQRKYRKQKSILKQINDAISDG